MNRSVLVLGLLAIAMSSNALGAGFLGPPTAEMQKGQWGIGYNYTYIDTDFDKTTMTEYIYLDGTLNEASSERMHAEDIKIHRHYGTIAYAVADWWEAYVQLGVADVKMKTRYEGERWTGINFDNDFAWGWGTRLTFHEQPNTRWGFSAQMNWLDTDADAPFMDSLDDTTYTGQTDVSFETYDLLLAVGPTVDMGGWILYGGPFYYYLSGDYDLDITALSGGGSVLTEDAHADLEEDSNFGGFIGAQFDLWENAGMTTEFSFTGAGWAAGAGLMWRTR